MRKYHTFALAKRKYGSLAQLNRASDYGSEGYRFESYRSHKERNIHSIFLSLLLYTSPPPPYFCTASQSLVSTENISFLIVAC